MKKRKIFKTLAFSSLAACMFCLPILAGCAPAEMLPEKPTQGQNFDLGLNPATDPVVYTTQSGLQIKKSDGKYSSTTTTTTNKGNTYTQDLRSFYYFTMGTFSGTIYTGEGGSTTASYSVSNEPVNWLIIGKGPGFNFESNTPAGSAIQGDVNKQEMAFSNSMYESIDLSSIPQHSDIPQGCFLVLSEKLLGQMYFNSSGAVNYRVGTSGGTYVPYGSVAQGNRYRYYGDIQTETAGAQTWTNKTDGSLYSYINSLFSKNASTGAIISGSNALGFTQAQADLIVPQQLYTFYSNGTGYPLAETPSTDGGTYYTMFPLAYRAEHTATKQNFCIEDYLKPGEQSLATLIGSNQAFGYWYRTGWISGPHGVLAVTTSGAHRGFYHTYWSFGVRPAFVISLSN